MVWEGPCIRFKSFAPLQKQTRTPYFHEWSIAMQRITHSLHLRWPKAMHTFESCIWLGPRKLPFTWSSEALRNYDACNLSCMRLSDRVLPPL